LLYQMDRFRKLHARVQQRIMNAGARSAPIELDSDNNYYVILFAVAQLKSAGLIPHQPFSSSRRGSLIKDGKEAERVPRLSWDAC
jgi:hypothetical protein